MDFFQHTSNWVKGEIYEATIFGSFGMLTIISSFLFWKLGQTPNSKAVAIPFAIVGFFFLVTAISGIAKNNQRLKEYHEIYEKDKKAFAKSEKQRVEDFQYLYKVTLIIAAISFTIAMVIFLFTDHYSLRAIALALIIFGFNGLIIDYFSKERADNYYHAIIKEIENH